ncbi:MAG: glycosyltransferase [Candidatus Omnitrophica bacterium CG11_big_fil_rev_8_21_14_0_20_64_10]|nr:MAG: glycosyltransferase [Candidatus Omnitrophica bacterium CG11_big_fil_rev_8_21_14_0_20_64_10]
MSGPGRRRILYLQYSDSNIYPSLLHSARTLSGRGWQVRFAATRSHGVSPIPLPTELEGTFHRIPFCRSGPLQKVHYLIFFIWSVVQSLVFRPGVVYASDPLAAWPALAAARAAGARLLYHEHDSPNPEELPERGWVQRAVAAGRWRIARAADVCVLPHPERARRFQEKTGRTGETHSVWNCPLKEEAAVPARPDLGKSFQLVYHGSLVPSRLPLTLLEGIALLPDPVRLQIAGYRTAGCAGYEAMLRRTAERLGISQRLHFSGLLDRKEMLALCRTTGVGISLVPLRSADFNERTMAGASNKAFEYLACGIPLLVPDLPDWRALFVEAGVARSCDPGRPESIAEALRWFLDHPDERVRMGEAGRRRILEEWNYETQFKPVLRWLEER